jgi:protein-arginine kinase
MNITWLKDLLLQFALDRVSDIAMGLVKLLIQAINDDRTDELLTQIQNPMHRQIARMVLDIIEQTLESVPTQPTTVDKVVLESGVTLKQAV